MAKLNLKTGAKLDMTVRGSSEELNLKTSLVKDAGDTLQLSMPMVGGKPFTPETGMLIVLSWAGDGTEYSLECTAAGTVKQGIRTYMVVKHTGDLQTNERRAFARVPAELDVEITSFDTGVGGARVSRIYPGRTSDISGGGIAVYTDAPMAVGETIDVSINEKGKWFPLRGAVCWIRPAPKHAGYRTSAGLQFFFLNSGESLEVAKLVAALATKA